MNTFSFTIVTPEEVIYEGEITQVTVPTQDGEITVMANHTPIVSLLAPGELRIKKPFESAEGRDEEHVVPMAVSFGFLEVRQNGDVVALADTAERAEHIDVERAKKARKRAEEILEKQEQEAEVDFARFRGELQKELARVKVAEKYSRK